MGQIDLSDEERRKLKKLLSCVKEEDFPTFAILLAHAENIDYTMKVVNSLTLVSGLSKKIVIWFVVIFGGITTLTGHLGEWLKALIAR